MTIGYANYKALLDTFVDLLLQALGEQVVAIVLYGSVARGKASMESDIDLLLVLQEAPPVYWQRLQPLLPILRRLRKQSCWNEVKARGLHPELNILVLSLEEADQNRHLYLDMIEEAHILVDKGGIFQSRLNLLQERLRELGARKVKRDGAWYWDIKPDLKPTETVAL